MPENLKNYIASWHKYCPDYQIIEWNESNFDINSNNYVKQAYESKKWAFVTDYVRLFVLYEYGGIYMDTDVELLKPLDEFLNLHAFSSFEDNDYVPTGLMAAEKNNKWIKDLLDEYSNINFIDEKGNMDTTTNVVRITNLTEKKYGLIRKSSYQNLANGIVTFFPSDYFCPKSWKTGNINITENTYAIHHFSGSWWSNEDKEKNKIIKKYVNKYGKKGELLGRFIFYIKHPIILIKKITTKIMK